LWNRKYGLWKNRRKLGEDRLQNNCEKCSVMDQGKDKETAYLLGREFSFCNYFFRKALKE
jgi:hypothetical protein